MNSLFDLSLIPVSSYCYGLLLFYSLTLNRTTEIFFAQCLFIGGIFLPCKFHFTVSFSAFLFLIKCILSLSKAFFFNNNFNVIMLLWVLCFVINSCCLYVIVVVNFALLLL